MPEYALLDKVTMKTEIALSFHSKKSFFDYYNRKKKKRRLNEIDNHGHHSFMDILYKKEKNVNLLSSLSGHKEVSKIFALYRDIDEDMKK